ncbi:hypothetical protein [Methylocapsa aurea]|uniref:hypothetical protein n=1 Tax=Methylocapsa aurea TaxID=663610 RepID=UPI00068A884B|nr:hypothetical protein [Methylocapsa aurea]
MLDVIPRTNALIGDRGYDADWSRKALAARRIDVCIPSKTYRKVPIPHDAALLPPPQDRDRRRVRTRYDRCAHAFMSAIALAVTVIFWL